MALVATVNERYPFGEAEILVGTLAFDATYPAGGEVLSMTELDCEQVVRISFDVKSAGGYVPGYDRANKKVLLYYGDNNNAADGPLIENATTDQSALTAVEFLALVK